MYSKTEASLITQKFWTSFGLYMSPVPSAFLEKVNWVNYKTGIKGIIFKLNADKNAATVTIEIFLKDTILQHQYFHTFTNFASAFKDIAGKDWLFNNDSYIENKGEVSTIIVELKNVNIFIEKDWPTIISFLKHYLIGLDAFWAAYKPAFEII